MAIKSYLNLKMPAYARLATLRGMAVLHNERRPPSTQCDWRAMRACGFHNVRSYCADLSQGRNGGDTVWYTHTGEAFRNERDADDIVSSLDSGWYTDNEQNDTAIGIVGMVSHNRFVAGYRWTCNDERVYFDGVFTDEDDAARMADGHARVFADNAREFDERFHDMTRAEDTVETSEASVRHALKARHVDDYWRDHARDMIAKLRNDRHDLKLAQKAYAS